MKKLDKNMIDFISKNNLQSELLKGNFGLEKENVRVDKFGRLAQTPHPKSFGDKLKNLYIKTDFSESQVEMITPVYNTLEDAYNFLENLHDIVSLELKEEFLWPQSTPPILPEDEEIPIAKYSNIEEGMQAEKYREKLAKKYGRKKQLISGIHYNFSFTDNFLEKLYKELETDNISFKEFRNKIYLKVSRNFLKYRWLMVYLTGCSTFIHKSYDERCNECMIKMDESYLYKYATSCRNGKHGYKNDKDYLVSFHSIKDYVKDITQLIESGELSSAKEFYYPIRPKTKNNDDILQSLLEEGINYLEVRLLDLNPFSKIGINIDSLYLVHLFMLFCLLIEDEGFDKECQRLANINHELVASMGRMTNLKLYENATLRVPINNKAIEILEEIRKIIEIIDEKKVFLNDVINDSKNKFSNSDNTLSSMLIKNIAEESYIDFHIKKSKENLDKSRKKEYNLLGYEDLELSTQILIKDAIKRGIGFEILDRKNNFIILDDGEKVEYIKQATKTSLDSYSTVLVMENKLITKKVLDRANVRVPKGRDYSDISIAKEDYEYFKGRSIVIKPNSTNFGLGITIFKEGFSKSLYNQAINIAFKHDDSVLVEEFIKGNEYRFFVLGDKVEGILRRVPANVTGDGEMNITQLVNEKNKNPLRGKGYRTPLEKIKLGESEKMFLEEQEKDFNYIPKKGEIVYLRENSNISTGGDSIDYTDDINQSYKDIVVKTAKAVGASICGVDMVIEDITKEVSWNNYGIIELNFNPAIHIHCYPYKGKNRKLGEKLLNLLGY